MWVNLHLWVTNDCKTYSRRWWQSCPLSACSKNGEVLGSTPLTLLIAKSFQRPTQECYLYESTQFFVSPEGFHDRAINTWNSCRLGLTSSYSLSGGVDNTQYFQKRQKEIMQPAEIRPIPWISWLYVKTNLIVTALILKQNKCLYATGKRNQVFLPYNGLIELCRIQGNHLYRYRFDWYLTSCIVLPISTHFPSTLFSIPKYITWIQIYHEMEIQIFLG